jgi:uncharacterized membrane-anchored protein YhcB (DUF1043 family)
MKWYHELLFGLVVGLFISYVIYRVMQDDSRVRVIEYSCIEDTCKVEFDELVVQFHELDADKTIMMLRHNHYNLNEEYLIFRRVR